jgi:predicted short-subunit dehydrogenase-like oxidoreductase (DUF2520 family)
MLAKFRHCFCSFTNHPDMLPAMARKRAIVIVGPGRLGTALALELRRAGYRIVEIVSRKQLAGKSLARKLGARTSSPASAVLDADLIWFCVPDREISPAAHALSSRIQWKGKIAFHSSGALASDELDVLRKHGAKVAAVHPLMTFVRGSIPQLKGVPFAVEGDGAAMRLAREIVRNLDGETFKIRARNKAAYHAWGAFTSPLLVALLVSAEQVARAAGLDATEARKKMLPILKQTIENYRRLGPAGAFSGPLVRGDAEIVRKHLQVLGHIPGAKEIYLALARTAVKHLPVQQRRKLESVLKHRSS